jgi:ParB family transcriptional regulator, chromosome partitioning protein
MSSRRRGLGSGLDALISSGSSVEQTVRLLDVSSIRENRSQPRTRFDEQALDELAASIREHGLIQPIIVIASPDAGYELIAGERRWRAAQRAGLNQIPALIKDATPQQLLELALVENVQRADLNPLEEGLAYQTLKDEFGLTDEEIARRVGKNRVSIVNARRLIRLVPEARQALLDGTISAGHGRAILRLEQPEQQIAALRLVAGRELSVREAERLAEVAQDGASAEPTREALLAGHISTAHAQALLRIDDKALQARAVEKVLTHGLSVRDTEALSEYLVEGASLEHALGRLQRPTPAPASPGATANTAPTLGARPESDNGEALQIAPEDMETRRLFEEALATPVQLNRSGNTVKLTITFYNEEQLQRFYDLVVGGN